MGQALADWLNTQDWKDRSNGAGWLIGHFVTHRPWASPPGSGEPEQPITEQWQIEYQPQRRELAIKLVHADKRAEMLSVFKELLNYGAESRLRCCPNCQRFWYAAGRSDKRACSDNCKVALWQKTPAGRKKRAKYMRTYRAKVKRLWDAEQKGRKLKRGRKLHVTLRKGE
jgi:hypothetical protein